VCCHCNEYFGQENTRADSHQISRTSANRDGRVYENVLGNAQYLSAKLSVKTA
jgi:hypothetical protein